MKANTQYLPREVSARFILSDQTVNLSSRVVFESWLTDMAVLEVDASLLSEEQLQLITPLEFATLEEMNRITGELKIVGYPSDLGLTLTRGSFSSHFFCEELGRLQQIQVPVTFGNSGGPLIATGLENKVVGVATLTGLDCPNMSYAIPIDVFESEYQRFLKRKNYWQPRSSFLHYNLIQDEDLSSFQQKAIPEELQQQSYLQVNEVLRDDGVFFEGDIILAENDMTRGDLNQRSLLSLFDIESSFAREGVWRKQAQFTILRGNQIKTVEAKGVIDEGATSLDLLNLDFILIDGIFFQQESNFHAHSLYEGRSRVTIGEIQLGSFAEFLDLQEGSLLTHMSYMEYKQAVVTIQDIRVFMGEVLKRGFDPEKETIGLHLVCISSFDDEQPIEQIQGAGMRFQGYSINLAKKRYVSVTMKQFIDRHYISDLGHYLNREGVNPEQPLRISEHSCVTLLESQAE